MNTKLTIFGSGFWLSELPLAKPFDAHRERRTTDPVPDFSRTLATAAACID